MTGQPVTPSSGQPAPSVAGSSTPPPSEPLARPADRQALLAGVVALLVLGLVAAGLVALVLGSGGGGAGPQPLARTAYAAAQVTPAPPLELTDQNGQPFSLSTLRGRPVLVFFGYTHCPDVCPANVGVINEALSQTRPGPRVVLVTVDPERDGVPAMKSYLRYLPTAYVGLTGTPDAIRRNADGWGVQYARIDEGTSDGYGMAHTADIFLVDAQGRMRARFPFGTEPSSIASALAQLLAESPVALDPTADPAVTAATQAPATQPAAPPNAAPSGLAHAPANTEPQSTTVPAADGATAPPRGSTSGGPPGPLTVTVLSTAIWAGGHTPLALSITDADGRELDGTVPVVARVVGVDGSPLGADVPAVAVRPIGITLVSFVATLDIPTAGRWRVDLTAANGAVGSVDVTALDPGNTAPLGAPAPDVRTPTLTDVNDVLLAVSTLPQADRRFYQASTSDARAAGRPYVLVLDSARFKVTQVCGSALSMAFYLLDRWNGRVTFVHQEPFVYRIVTDEPVLSGDLSDPPLTANAQAFGLGDATWPATNMPWVFVVDGQGIVRAKYNGIVGSRDVDLILSLITGDGVISG